MYCPKKTVQPYLIFASVFYPLQARNQRFLPAGVLTSPVRKPLAVLISVDMPLSSPTLQFLNRGFRKAVTGTQQLDETRHKAWQDPHETIAVIQRSCKAPFAHPLYADGYRASRL